MANDTNAQGHRALGAAARPGIDSVQNERVEDELNTWDAAAKVCSAFLDHIEWTDSPGAPWHLLSETDDAWFRREARALSKRVQEHAIHMTSEELAATTEFLVTVIKQADDIPEGTAEAGASLGDAFLDAKKTLAP
jgi:hypothetical protein